MRVSLIFFGDVIPVGFFLLYLASGTWLLYRGWPIRAGLAMIVVAYLPIGWQVWFTDSDMPGLAILFTFMLPIPLLLIIGGLVGVVVRLFRRRRALMQSN